MIPRRACFSAAASLISKLPRRQVVDWCDFVEGLEYDSEFADFKKILSNT